VLALAGFDRKTNAPLMNEDPLEIVLSEVGCAGLNRIIKDNPKTQALELICGSGDFDHSPLQQLENLRKLIIHGDFEILPDFGELPQVEELHLFECCDLLDISNIVRFPNVTTLEISDVLNLECDKWKPISKLTNLRHLNLDRNSTFNHADDFKTLVNLETFSAVDCPDLACVYGVLDLPMLRELRLPARSRFYLLRQDFKGELHYEELRHFHKR
tara:strand:- start:2844 stop:3488 length:645 start_codon:yes stop_codon:yes gene_type:complete